MNSSALSKWDSSGVAQTCSLINKVIDHLEESEDTNARDFIDIMEKIRTFNSDLREHGALLNWDLTEKIGELEDRIGDLNEKVEDLEGEITDLTADVSSLEAQLDALPSKYDY